MLLLKPQEVNIEQTHQRVKQDRARCNKKSSSFLTRNLSESKEDGLTKRHGRQS